MPVVAAIKLAIEGIKHWRIIVVVGFIILMFPLFISTIFVSAKYVPAIDDDIVKIYIDAANSAAQGKDIYIDYMSLISIDAVRYKQDFSDVSLKDAIELANRFVKRVETVQTSQATDAEGNTFLVSVIVITYELYSLAEVESQLNMSNDEIASVNDYLEGFASSGIGRSSGGGGGGNADTASFIAKIKDGAIESYKLYKIYPSVTIAQAILESGWGSSSLSYKYNNLFGIKANNWSGPKVQLETGEHYDTRIFAYFRVYSSWTESIIDHGKFLNENSRYSRYGVFSANNCEQQVKALENAGYATVADETGRLIYAQLLLQVINQYNLKQYDNEAILVNN